jgi:hypothetical protein
MDSRGFPRIRERPDVRCRSNCDVVVGGADRIGRSAAIDRLQLGRAASGGSILVPGDENGRSTVAWTTPCLRDIHDTRAIQVRSPVYGQTDDSRGSDSVSGRQPGRRRHQQRTGGAGLLHQARVSFDEVVFVVFADRPIRRSENILSLVVDRCRSCQGARREMIKGSCHD